MTYAQYRIEVARGRMTTPRGMTGYEHWKSLSAPAAVRTQQASSGHRPGSINIFKRSDYQAPDRQAKYDRNEAERKKRAAAAEDLKQKKMAEYAAAVALREKRAREATARAAAAAAKRARETSGNFYGTSRDAQEIVRRQAEAQTHQQRVTVLREAQARPKPKPIPKKPIKTVSRVPVEPIVERAPVERGRTTPSAGGSLNQATAPCEGITGAPFGGRLCGTQLRLGPIPGMPRGARQGISGAPLSGVYIEGGTLHVPLPGNVLRALGR